MRIHNSTKCIKTSNIWFNIRILQVWDDPERTYADKGTETNMQIK